MFLEPECKDPENIHGEKCAVVEADSTEKETNSLESENFTVEETSFPVVTEVMIESEESSTTKIGDDESQSKDTCAVDVAEDLVKVMEQNNGEKVNGEVEKEDSKYETGTYDMDDVD